MAEELLRGSRLRKRAYPCMLEGRSGKRAMTRTFDGQDRETAIKIAQEKILEREDKGSIFEGMTLGLSVPGEHIAVRFCNGELSAC